jgi:hypothetical protein
MVDFTLIPVTAWNAGIDQVIKTARFADLRQNTTAIGLYGLSVTSGSPKRPLVKRN